MGNLPIIDISVLRPGDESGLRAVLASYFSASKAATLDMIRAQGAIVSWITSLRQLRDAVL